METENGAEAAGPALPDADINASLEPIAGNAAANGLAPPRFVGRWATFRSLCGRREWHVTENELRTPEGYVCRFNDVREVADGYEIAARCRTAPAERDDTLRMAFTESARTMLFASDNIANAILVRCED